MTSAGQSDTMDTTLLILLSVSTTISASSQYEYLDRRDSMKLGNSLARAITYNKPTVPLEFWEKVKKKPRGRQLKETKLLEKMGSDFDPSWMAVERPRARHNIKVSLPEEEVARLMEEVSSLDIENDIREMLDREPDQEHEPTVVRAVGAFQQWLVRKSSCPVEFDWVDLGEYFWPRYLRKGECQSGEDSDPALSSCSWPRGMSCNPAGAEVLHILRWHCRRRRTPDLLGLTTRQKIRKSYKCRWIKVPYPVTSSCKCD